MNQITLKESDIERIARLSDEDIARLYQHLTNRLRATKRLDAPNAGGS